MLYSLLLVSALSLLALIPLLQANLFASSDGLYHIYRSIEIGSCLEDAVWVCRWAPHQFLGYGTPLFDFYSPFIYYITNVFHALGLGWVNATRAMMALFMVFSGVSAFAYASEFLSKRAAVVAAVAYVYVPYHLVNAYFRGDLPEFAAMAWFPAIGWAFSRLARPIARRRDWIYFPLAALAYAGLVVTHNLSAFIYTGILVVYCLLLLISNRLEGAYRSTPALIWPALRLAGASLLAFGLSAFLAVPALVEKDLVTLEGLLYVSAADHFPTLQQILPNAIVHVYGIIFPDSPEYAYKMGLVQVGLGGLGGLAALLFWKRFRWRARGEAVISVIVFAVAFFFARPASLFLWNMIPLLGHVQFPWRFLLLMALPTSLMVGYVVDAFTPRWRVWLAPALVTFALLTNLLGLKPIMSNANDGEIDLTSSVEFELLYHLMGTTVAGEYIPRTVTDRPFVNPTALAWVLGGTAEPVHPTASDPNLKVAQLERRATSATYRVSASQPGKAVFNVVYFPDWRATLDGQPVPAVPNPSQGLISVDVPPGEHTVRLAFGNTPIRTWSERVSLLAALLTIAALAFALSKPLPRFSLPHLAVPRPSARLALALAPFLVVAVALPVGIKLFARGYLPPPLAQHPLKIDLANSLMVYGYDLGLNGQLLQRRDTIPAGSTADLAIYWRAQDQSDRALGAKIFARVSNIDEQQWSYAFESQRDELSEPRTFRSRIRLPIPSALPPGAYQIDVGALGRDGRPFQVRNMEMVELLPVQGSVRLGPLLVKGVPQQAADLRFPSTVNFDGRVGLDTFDLSRGVTDRRALPEPAERDASGVVKAAAGDVLQLDLGWRALKPEAGHLKVSASLIDDKDFKWGVRDAEPADGMYPSWMWQPGQPVRDQLRMVVPAETPPGRYRLALRLLDGDRPLSVLGPNGSPSGAQAILADVDLAKSDRPPRTNEIMGVTSRDSVKVNDDLEIVASNLGRTELRPGESTDVTLVWRALRDIKRDMQVRLSLVDITGKVTGSVTSRPVGDRYPTDQWDNREIFRGQFHLVAAANAAKGKGKLQLEVLEPDGSVSAKRDLGPMDVLERPGRAAVADAKNPFDALFGPAIHLIGFDTQPDFTGGRVNVRAGQSLTVKLLWQAEAAPDKSYTVFVQLLNSDGQLVGQDDSLPDGGKSPTTGWFPGDRIPDTHKIDLNRSLPAGDYQLIVGLYDRATGDRLTLPDGENHAKLTPIRLTAR